MARTSSNNPQKRTSFFQKLFSEFPDGLLQLDSESNITMANKAAELLFGYSSDEIVKKNVRELFPNWNNAEVVASKINPNAHSMKLRGKTKSGEPFYAEVSIGVSVCSDKFITMISIRDKSVSQNESKKMKLEYEKLLENNKQLATLAKTDQLTGLLNRRGMEKLLEREVAYAKRNKTELLAALIDLDDFKKVNDTKGHATGDIVLKSVAGALKKEIRAIDWIGRVGGDEFLVLLPSTSLSDGAKVAERMRLSLNKKYISTSHGSIKVTASIGLVKLPYNILSIEEVLELTQISIKCSKSRGKNRITLGDDGCFESSISALPDIKKLLTDRDFYRAVAQNIVRLSDQKVIGYELFTRGPKGPLEMPQSFLSVSEENSIITSVDLHCLNVCLEKAKHLPSDCSIHINILPSTLIEVPTAKLVDQIKKKKLKQKLYLELSERKLTAEPSHLVKAVNALKNNGISVILDDIGCGSSSIETILMLDPDFIKIDGSLVKDASKNIDRYKAIVKITKMIQAIDLKIIAEGIENECDLQVLKSLNIAYGQGWLWGKSS